jgi:hypothetical protein
MKAKNITKQGLATKIERLFQKERNEYTAFGLHDPLSDTKVIVKDDHILIVFDGGGNDMLTLGCGHPLRSALNSLVEAHCTECYGLHVEDNNNWSASIWF